MLVGSGGLKGRCMWQRGLYTGDMVCAQRMHTQQQAKDTANSCALLGRHPIAPGSRHGACACFAMTNYLMHHHLSEHTTAGGPASQALCPWAHAAL